MRRCEISTLGERIVQIISTSREVSIQLKLEEIRTLKKEIKAIREEVERLVKEDASCRN